MSSNNGYKYYIHCVDSYSIFTWLYLLRQKSDAFQVFLNFKALVQLQLEYKLKAIQTDWGGEYRVFTDYLTSNGIVHRNSFPHTHEQNGTAERKHKHIMEKGLTLLAQSSMPFMFWDEAFRASIFLISRLPTPVLQNKTPLEMLFHKSPDYSQLRDLGCAATPIQSLVIDSMVLDVHSKPCTVLGYSISLKGYKCLDSNGRIFISRDVINILCLLSRKYPLIFVKSS